MTPSFTKTPLNKARCAVVVLVAGFAMLLPGGCASQDDPSLEAQRAHGNIPWNRPEKWEGPGVLGSMMQGQ